MPSLGVLRVLRTLNLSLIAKNKKQGVGLSEPGSIK